MAAKILRELFKVQHSILVGVPDLHDLKMQRVRAQNMVIQVIHTEDKTQAQVLQIYSRAW